MYTDIKSVQLLVALLKEYHIQNIVLSPGGSDIPIIHSIEEDPYFRCFSVVDERSAAYFAMGIAQETNKPAACVCTSGTAACNYLPGMTEAYYQDVPIIAITADKNPYFQGQIETQKIDQQNIFEGVCKKSVNLPVIHDELEYWYCERLICEALLEVNHNGTGPVHINIPITGSTSNYYIEHLPNVKPIRLVSYGEPDDTWLSYAKTLSEAQRILVVIGQNVNFTDHAIQHIEKFFEKYNCAIAVEHLSNLRCNGVVDSYAVTETTRGKCDISLLPDLVITLGNNLSAYNLKTFLRKNRKNIKHWQIDEAGRVRDVYQSLTTIFQCSPAYFFKFYSDHAPVSIKNSLEYYTNWKNAVNAIKKPSFPFSNFYIAQQLASIVPAGSIMHLAILNSTRILQFFPLSKGVKVYSNTGALGIDGCLSAFCGQAAATEQLAFCVIGDLSFFYDMNAAGIRHNGKNIRIILLNNGGGSEFHFFMGKKNIPTINDFICAEHQKRAAGWIESLGYQYYTARNKEELDHILPKFAEVSDTPMFLEVFTDMENDAALTNSFYDMYKPEPSVGDKALAVAKGVAKKIIGKY